ncbi:MAG: hypothetical protein WBB19_17320 [Desulforhopalus sp.]
MARQSEKILVTMEEIAAYTGRNKKTIMEWVGNDNFPAVKEKGRWTAHADLIDIWHKQNIEKMVCGEVE